MRRCYEMALTGPAAAAEHGLDGFRDLIWPERWSAPVPSEIVPGIRRTRLWAGSVQIGNGPLLAGIPLVCRHLNGNPEDLADLPDGIAPRDRVELAVEHARRLGYTIRAASGGGFSGDKMLRQVLYLAGSEPPTESYAETSTMQEFRGWGMNPWRQCVVRVGGRNMRIDFGFSLGLRRPPNVFRPDNVLLCDLDSEQFHRENFEADRERWAALDRAGFRHLSITPRQMTRDPEAVRRRIERLLATLR